MVTIPIGESLDVSGRAYVNDTIALGGNRPASSNIQTTLNIDGPAEVGAIYIGSFAGSGVVNVDGVARIGEINAPIFRQATLTINLDEHAHLRTTFESANLVTVNGGDNAAIANVGASTVSVAEILTNVRGEGSWSFVPTGRQFGGFLRFGEAVSGGQTINMSHSGSLTIDQPGEFHGLVTIDDLWSQGSILLSGVHGDTFSYRDDMLRIFDDGKTVARLRIDEGPNSSFTVSDTSQGTMLSEPPTAMKQEMFGDILPG